MMSLLACGIGFVLDLLFGDPVWLYHPVRLIGRLITFLENGMRSLCKEDPKKLVFAGGVLCILVIGISVAVPAVCLYAIYKIHPVFGLALESFWCYQLLATKSLRVESRKVYGELAKGDLQGARTAVSMIVGRDTEQLDETGIVKATVETVAENTSDGVTAPLICMLFGGVLLGFFYKAVNTLDSMIGYKDDRYLYLGRMAAKLDDILNYIPARLSAYIMMAGAFVLRYDTKNAWSIYRRDRKKHASPNSAQTEAVCAGALQIQLAGDAWYFGKLYKKDYIGDPIRPVEMEDINRAGHLLYATAILTFLLAAICKIVTIL